MRNVWEGAKIIYVIVHKMNTRPIEKQEENYNAIISVCNKWSIDYVDIYNKGELNSFISSMRDYYFPVDDGTHPNESGYRNFYIPKLKAKLKENI